MTPRHRGRDTDGHGTHPHGSHSKLLLASSSTLLLCLTLRVRALVVISGFAKLTINLCPLHLLHFNWSISFWV